MEFTRAEIAKLTSFTPRMISYYVDRKVVHPEIKDQSGRGRTRLFSFSNVVEFGILNVLRGSNFSPGDCSYALDFLRERPINGVEVFRNPEMLMEFEVLLNINRFVEYNNEGKEDFERWGRVWQVISYKRGDKEAEKEHQKELVQMISEHFHTYIVNVSAIYRSIKYCIERGEK